VGEQCGLLGMRAAWGGEPRPLPDRQEGAHRGDALAFRPPDRPIAPALVLAASAAVTTGAGCVPACPAPGHDQVLGIGPEPSPEAGTGLAPREHRVRLETPRL